MTIIQALQPSGHATDGSSCFNGFSRVGRLLSFTVRRRGVASHAIARLAVALTMIRHTLGSVSFCFTPWGVSMRTIDDYGTFEDAVAKASAHARELAYQLRTLVAAVLPEVVEVPWPKMRMASYGVGPRKKSEHFCYISAQNDDVNLGFYYGAELPDPEGLLQGTGKLLRHVKIREPKAIRSRGLRQLLKVATKHRMPAQAGE
jgi:hypothetical protein